MSSLYFTYPLNGLLMIALPLALGIFLARRLGTRWALYGIGAVTFVAAQVVHIPLNLGLTALFAQGILPQPPAAWGAWFNPVVLGLTAGLCEELARYIVLLTWLKRARAWREALMFGAGHGGIEAILLGLSVLLAFINFVYLKQAGLDLVPAEQRDLVSRQLAAYWSAAWPLSLLGAVERLFSLCVHLALAVLVMQAVARRNPLWLAAAILFHAAANAATLIALQPLGPYGAEAVVGAFALAGLGIIYALRPAAGADGPPAVPAPAAPPIPAVASPAPPPPEAEAERARQLEETKYERPAG